MAHFQGDLNFTEPRAVGVYVASGISILCGFVAAVGLFNLWRLRFLPFVQKRHPVLVLASCISLILVLMVERPLFALLSFSTFDKSWGLYVWILHVILLQTEYFCVCCRIYVTCFDISFARAEAASLWVKHIDIHSKCKKTSFIVEHYTTFGDLSKIKPCLTALIVLSTVITVLVGVLAGVEYHEYTRWLNTSILILTTIIMCFFWWNTPYFLDFLKIRAEIRAIVAMQIGVIAANLTLFVIGTVQNLPFYMRMVAFCLNTAFAILLAYTQTFWVLRKIHESRIMRSAEHSATESSYPEGPDGDDADNDKNVLQLDIIDVIREIVGFEAFMNHLSKEFSMENMLALVEFNQYKQHYRDITQVKKDIDDGIDPLARVGSSVVKKVFLSALKTLSVGNQTVPDDPEEEQQEEEQQDEPKPSEQAQPRNKENSYSIDLDAIDDDEDEEDYMAGMGSEPQPVELRPQIAPSTADANNQRRHTAAMKRNRTLINITEQTVTLPNELPYSTIVFGENYEESEETKRIAFMIDVDLRKESIRIIRLLFDKYIVVGSELELNLSHRLRSRCMDKLAEIQDMDNERLEHMFDRCIGSLLKLMQDSYLRFKTTEEFIKYQEKARRRAKSNSAISKDSLGGVFGDLMDP